MTKIIERNLAELIVIGVFTICFFSSCGIQMGNYERWKEVHGKPECKIELSQEDMYTSMNDCHNCDEID